MTEPKRPLKIFLCHAHSDRDVVHALYTRLAKDGMDVWLDRRISSRGQIGNLRSARPYMKRMW